VLLWRLEFVIAHPARQPDRPRSCPALTPLISVAAEGGL
jgi:hypothetical protein